MKIFTFRKVAYLLIVILCSALSSSAVSIESVKDGNWSDITTWSPQQIPSSSDIVTIKSEHTVTVDINATCSKLLVGESNKDNTVLIIAAGKFLNVMGAVEIYGNNVLSNPTIFNVGDGTLNVGESITFYASPGYANLEIGTGTINVVGNLDFNASGQGNIKRRSVENEGTINLGGKVIGTGSIEGNQPNVSNPSLPNDYYRSQKSDDWSLPASWLTSRDGISNWLPAKFAPTGSALRIEIMGSHKISLSTNSPAANLIVYGTLECKQFIISGPGPFRLESGANFITSNSLGISSSGVSGSIQVDGTRLYSGDANYTYEAAVSQITGDGLPATLNGILTVNNTGTTPSVTLSRATLSTNLVFVTNGTLISDGKLTLESTASNYAQIGPLNGNATVSGNVNVQSFFSGSLSSLTNRGNRMISSPVKDNPSPDISSPSVFQQLREKMIITGPNVGQTASYDFNKFDLGGTAQPYAETITTYSEPDLPSTSFKAVPSITTQTTPGKAYFLFFRGRRDIDPWKKINSPYAYPEDVTGIYKGTINQGPLSLPITYTSNNTAQDANNGMNAVGNPYPAAIDWDAVWTTNKSTLEVNEIRINKAAGGFVTRKVIDGVETTINSGENMASCYIQPGQGFYIKTLKSGLLTFNESHKVVTSSAARLLSLPSSNLLSADLNGGTRISDIVQKEKFLRISIRQNDLKDETLILFKDGLSSGFDNNDAIYFAGNTVLIGSMSSDGKVTSINAMPDVKDVEELKLYVSANASGTYTLNFTDVSAAQGYQVFLKDALFPDKLLDLHQQTIYEFSIEQKNSKTYGSNRFSVVFKPELIEAPVTFIVEKVKSNVELNWITEAAQKIKYFEVEVSEDKLSFTNIGQVANAGKNTKVQYSFVDKSPAGTIRYYRLKQFNANGSITFTDPRKIDLSNAGIGIASINVYPNPSTDKIQVNLNQKAGAGVQAVIFNVQGQKMKTNLFSANQTVEMLVNELPGGVYLLELRNQATTELIGQSKFVVSR